MLLSVLSKRKRVTMILLMMSLLPVWFIGHSSVSAGGPRLRCDAASPGDVVYVQGEDFTPGAILAQLRWDGVVIPWSPDGLTVGDNGRFTLWFTVPSDTYELHTLVANDSEGGQGECYLNLTPHHPTPTQTPTPTLTPSPTPTATPGPPPEITITPIPAPTDYCAVMSAAFTRDLVAGSTIQVGLDVINTNIAWPANQVQIGLWQYYNLDESDTGERVNLPALATGARTTLSFSFQENESGPIWYQLRLIDTTTGLLSGCVSAWYALYIQEAVPYPPPVLEPANNVWLDTRRLSLAWLAAEVPSGAGSVTQYEVQLSQVGGGDLLYQATGSTLANYILATDYGANRLAWRVRAQNDAGWGAWSNHFYFGVDTNQPVVTITVQGTVGDNGWYVSPVTVQVDGHDPAPGSGLVTAFLQPGRAKWQQVVPGNWNRVDQEGEIFLRAYGRDDALNLSPVVVNPIKLDRTPPEQISVDFSEDPTTSGWYIAPVTIEISASDSVSGVAERSVRADGESWQAAPVTLTEGGNHTLEYIARDVAGNETIIRQTTAKLDLTPPTGTISSTGTLCQTCNPMTMTVTLTDADSGIGHWILSVAEPGDIEETILASGESPDQVLLAGSDFPVGTLSLRLAVQDVAGWVSTQQVEIINGATEPGATPTSTSPDPTATLWPTPASNKVTPTARTAVTATPGPGDDPGAGDGGGENEEDSTPPTDGNYPVGGQVVPVLLPVTGGAGPGLSILILAVVGLGMIVLVVWPQR